MSQLSLFGVPEHQVSTCQVPIGDHSIFDALEKKEVTQGECWVYLVVNLHSKWDEGESYARSYAQLAKFAGMPRASVIAIINSLIEKSWLTKTVRNKTGSVQNRANIYELTHHQCDSDQVPLDSDGRPRKCAVPRDQGSVFQMVEDKVIDWKAALYWIISKIDDDSDWTTGIVEMTIAKAKGLMRMTTETICGIRKKLSQVGLLEQISKPFRAFTCVLLPKPYEKRRQRRIENPKDLPVDKDFYYSLNRKFRLSRQDGQIEVRVEGPGKKWRHANVGELQNEHGTMGKKIYKDFKPLIDLITSPYYQKYHVDTLQTAS